MKRVKYIFVFFLLLSLSVGINSCDGGNVGCGPQEPEKNDLTGLTGKVIEYIVPGSDDYFNLENYFEGKQRPIMVKFFGELKPNDQMPLETYDWSDYFSDVVVVSDDSKDKIAFSNFRVIDSTYSKWEEEYKCKLSEVNGKRVWSSEYNNGNGGDGSACDELRFDVDVLSPLGAREPVHFKIESMLAKPLVTWTRAQETEGDVNKWVGELEVTYWNAKGGIPLRLMDSFVRAFDRLYRYELYNRSEMTGDDQDVNLITTVNYPPSLPLGFLFNVPLERFGVFTSEENLMFGGIGELYSGSSLFKHNQFISKWITIDPKYRSNAEIWWYSLEGLPLSKKVRIFLLSEDYTSFIPRGINYPSEVTRVMFGYPSRSYEGESLFDDYVITFTTSTIKFVKNESQDNMVKVNAFGAFKEVLNFKHINSSPPKLYLLADWKQLSNKQISFLNLGIINNGIEPVSHKYLFDYGLFPGDTGELFRADEGFLEGLNTLVMICSFLPGDYCKIAIPFYLNPEFMINGLDLYYVDRVKFLNVKMKGFNRFSSKSREKIVGIDMIPIGANPDVDDITDNGTVDIYAYFPIGLAKTLIQNIWIKHVVNSNKNYFEIYAIDYNDLLTTITQKEKTLKFLDMLHNKYSIYGSSFTISADELKGTIGISSLKVKLIGIIPSQIKLSSGNVRIKKVYTKSGSVYYESQQGEKYFMRYKIRIPFEYERAGNLGNGVIVIEGYIDPINNNGQLYFREFLMGIVKYKEYVLGFIPIQNFLPLNKNLFMKFHHEFENLLKFWLDLQLTRVLDRNESPVYSLLKFFFNEIDFKNMDSGMVQPLLYLFGLKGNDKGVQIDIFDSNCNGLNLITLFFFNPYCSDISIYDELLNENYEDETFHKKARTFFCAFSNNSITKDGSEYSFFYRTNAPTFLTVAGGDSLLPFDLKEYNQKKIKIFSLEKFSFLYNVDKPLRSVFHLSGCEKFTPHFPDKVVAGSALLWERVINTMLKFFIFDYKRIAWKVNVNEFKDGKKIPVDYIFVQQEAIETLKFSTVIGGRY